MIYIFSALFFVLGLIIGSFLNVVICRFNTARSLGGRSACMNCQNKLKWYELIPLFSFFALEGRCRTCKSRISIIYPLVEIITGLVFVILFLKFSALGAPFGGQNISVFAVTYAYYAFMFSLLLVIAVYDLKHKIIPDTLSFIFGILAFFSLFFFPATAGQVSSNFSNFPLFYWHIPSVLEFFSGPLIALPFYLFWLMSGGRWMGLGDAKLALGLGYFLGFYLAFSALVLAFWTGATVGLCLIIFRKGYGMKSEIPFALYLVLGAFLAFIFNLCLFAPFCY